MIIYLYEHNFGPSIALVTTYPTCDLCPHICRPIAVNHPISFILSPLFSHVNHVLLIISKNLVFLLEYARIWNMANGRIDISAIHCITIRLCIYSTIINDVDQDCHISCPSRTAKHAHWTNIYT